MFAPTRHRSPARTVLRLLSMVIFAFLYLPILVLIVYSFSESRVFTFPMTGLSLRWYAVLFSDRDLLRSIVNSLIVAAAVVPICLVFGVATAFALDRFSFPGKAAFERIVMLPLIIPGLITGLSILLLLKRVDVPLSLATVTVGHSIAWLPVVVTQVYARLRRFDRRLEEVSMDLGAGRAQTFLRVTLPNIRTALIGSSLLVFTLSFDEIAITFFLTGTRNTLPMHIWSMLREGVTPEVNAVAAITVLLSIFLITLGIRLGRGDAMS
jgi:spermidine/putrescine transport system permease protein